MIKKTQISYKQSQKCMLLTDFFVTDPVALYHNKDFKTQHDKIFLLLSDNQPHSCLELINLGIPQYNARILELRRGLNKIANFGVICDIINLTDNEGNTYFKMLGYRIKDGTD